ncbi:MAG: hypothetical protein APR63_01935 [Desulfuromonas sp. SDB]|nr:MAG: hypothetical protein APR63_01935 [Desulfuromonas sp. SDB]
MVIPVFNEQATINKNHYRLSKFMEKQSSAFELIYIDDGSKDETLKILLEKIRCTKFPLTVIKLSENFGQHQAVLAGMSQASGKFIITCDADLQSPPRAINMLIRNIQPEDMILSGWRKNRDDLPLRRIYSFILNLFLSKFFNENIHDIGSMLKAYRYDAVKNILNHQKKSAFVPVLALKLGYSIKEIPTPHYSRKDDYSKYSFFKLIKLFLNLFSEIISSSTTSNKKYYRFNWIIKSSSFHKNLKQIFLVCPFHLSRWGQIFTEGLKDNFNLISFYYNDESQDLTGKNIYFLKPYDLNLLMENYLHFSNFLATAEVSPDEIKFSFPRLKHHNEKSQIFKNSGNIECKMIKSLIQNINSAIYENF